MKRIYSIFFLFFALNLAAQEKHFVFIQSDNQQIFYVSVNGKLYSSSATGYVIIPKLNEGQYTFSIGFAKTEAPEQSFPVNINKKDLGYSLKNFGEKGWGLFNLQTMDVTMGTTGATSSLAKNSSEQPIKDPSLISFDKPKKETLQVAAVAPDISKDEKKSDSVNNINITANSPAGLPDNSATTTLPASTTQADREPASDVKKVSEIKNEAGLTLSFIEGADSKGDTIHITIPSSPTVINSSTIAKNTTIETGVVVTKPEEAPKTAAKNKDNPKFLDIEINNNKSETSSSNNATAQGSAATSNSNCKNVATDDDYARLRKKMASETTDEKMINEAKKFYRNMCFTTSQIKGLSTLFLSDEGRYKFFDASYVSVADISQYSTLVTEFIDPAFATRFKAMLQ